MSGELVSIEPPELRFPIELKKQVSCSLQFVNRTKSKVAFKIKTTAPKNYSVRPNIGTIGPGEVCNVTVTMRALYQMPPELQSRDIFLVQTMLTTQSTQSDERLQELFRKASVDELKEIRLRVVFLNPRASSSPLPPPTLPIAPTLPIVNDEIAAEPKAPPGFSFSFVLLVAVLGILVGFFLRGDRLWLASL